MNRKVSKMSEKYKYKMVNFGCGIKKLKKVEIYEGVYEYSTLKEIQEWAKMKGFRSMKEVNKYLSENSKVVEAKESKEKSN